MEPQEFVDLGMSRYIRRGENDIAHRERKVAEKNYRVLIATETDS